MRLWLQHYARRKAKSLVSKTCGIARVARGLKRLHLLVMERLHLLAMGLLVMITSPAELEDTAEPLAPEPLAPEPLPADPPPAEPPFPLPSS